MSAFRYKAFISYSHADRAWTRWLHRSLERYRVPKRLVGQASPAGPIPPRLTPIFRDRDELATSSDLGSVLEQALSESESLIVVCSPASACSRWVNEEIRFFRKLGRGERIFCLIVDGEPNASASPDAQAQECFPAMLHQPLAAGAEGPSADRVAADVRPSGDGKLLAKLKLVAGLLGIGLDELRQREIQRRHKRLVGIAASALVGMLLMTALAAAAFMARAEADRQRVRAELQAKTASETSEFLVSLFQVVDPSEAKGREIKALDILERGTQRINRDLKDQPAVRANLLNTMGRVYTGLGLYARAEALLEAALESEGISEGKSASNRAQILTAYAAALFEAGNYDMADAAAAEAVERARSSSVPGRDLISALIVRANVLSQKEQDSEADALFNEALDLDAARGLEAGGERALALHGLGLSLLYQGRLDLARKNLQAALELHERIQGEDHPQTIEALNNLSNIAYAQNNATEAERLLSQAVSRAERVYGMEHPQTSSMLNNLGRIQLERGAIDEAETTLARTVAVDRLTKKPGHDDFVYSLNNLGLVYLVSNRPALAQPLFNDALEIARAQAQGHEMEGSILANLADLKCQSGATSEGLAMTDHAHEALTKHRAPGDWRFARLKMAKGSCLAANGQREEAFLMLQEAAEMLNAAKGADSLFSMQARERLAQLAANQANSVD